MSNQDTDFGAFLAGFVLGGLVGAAAALLLAPQSGEETRTVIRDKSIELRDKASESATEALERAEKAMEEARLRAEEALAEARTKAGEVAETTKQRASDLQHRGQVVIEEQRAKIEGAVEAGKKAVKKEAGKSEADTPASAEAEA